jgi:F-type H+-transporting ATPase subunit b
MAEPTAHSEAPEGHGGFPPFQAQHFPSQLVWLTLTFVLLYVLMSKVALPRIGAILADRSKRISDHLAEAQSLKDQSDAANAAYEKALADARNRAQAIANATRQKQAAEADEAQKRLEAQLQERLAAAEQSITATRTSAMTNVRTIAADAAGAIVQRLIGTTPSEQDVAAAVGEVAKP